ncbi:MAG: hypothetical protein ABIC91_04020 [Nanoarchaeota archaeon]|nr:hypothetical protein [Nanoarchaeota archaeon]MBU1030861.1 hypothetical protein [Nanoarchaeota archaeon]MBU1850723.1 hypothetical protein [Nanoarchaeota archaeon]
MSFIEVNNRILDYEEYCKDLTLLINELMIATHDVVRMYGFEKKENEFMNKDLNLKITLNFEKLKEEKFV